MITAHSKYSASKFKTLMLCAGKLRMEHGYPNKPSRYAAEGTAAHTVLEAELLGKDTKAMLGYVMNIDGFKISVDTEMIMHAQRTAANINELCQGALVKQTETRVNYAEWLGVAEHEGWGTADFCALMNDGTLQIHDYKYGAGVAVDVENNVQLMLYALGAYEMFKDFARITDLSLFIHQPRVTPEPQRFDMSVEALVNWVSTEAQPAVNRIESIDEMPMDLIEDFLTPGPEQCRFCRARGGCKKARDEAFTTVFSGSASAASPDEFMVMTQDHPVINPKHSDDAWFAVIVPKLEHIRGWCEAVQEEADARVLNGGQIRGLKVVQGRKGNRKWDDPAQAEAVMKAARLRQDVMYEQSLVSPTEAERRAAAGTLPQRIWIRLKGLVNQSEGKPTVVPESDRRPAMQVRAKAEEFDPIDIEIG